MWQKNVLNKAVLSGSGTDWGLVADVAYGEGLKEGLLVVKNESTKSTSVIPSSKIEIIDNSLIVSESAIFASLSEHDAKIADSETIKESSIISIFDDGITEVLLVDLFLTTSNPSFNPSPYVTSATRPQSVPLLDETVLLRTFFCHMV